jgi:hypothetical protein
MAVGSFKQHMNVMMDLNAHARGGRLSRPSRSREVKAAGLATIYGAAAISR